MTRPGPKARKSSPFFDLKSAVGALGLPALIVPDPHAYVVAVSGESKYGRYEAFLIRSKSCAGAVKKAVRGLERIGLLDESKVLGVVSANAIKGMERVLDHVFTEAELVGIVTKNGGGWARK